MHENPYCSLCGYIISPLWHGIHSPMLIRITFVSFTPILQGYINGGSRLERCPLETASNVENDFMAWPPSCNRIHGLTEQTNTASIIYASIPIKTLGHIHQLKPCYSWFQDVNANVRAHSPICEDLCARSRYQGRGQIITSHGICGM